MNSIAVGGHSSQNSIGVLGFAAGGDAPTITVVTRSLSDSLSMSDTITVRVTRARSTNRLTIIVRLCYKNKERPPFSD